MNEMTTSNGLGDQIAEEVRVLLVRRRLTAVSVAKRLGWTQSYLAHRLTGRQPFNVDDLQSIARALGVKVVDLLPREERNPSIASYATGPVPAGSRRPGGPAPAGPSRPAGRSDSRGPADRRTALTGR